MAEETNEETREETIDETSEPAEAEAADAGEADDDERAEELELGIPTDEITVDVGMRAAETRGQHRRKVRVGVVKRAVQDKTVTVEVQRQFAHPLYGKQVGRSKNYHAHDEENRCHPGDIVRIVETRPISKTKRWRVAELIEQAE